MNGSVAGKDLVVALDGVPGNLDPYRCNDLYSHFAIWPVYEPLFDIGDDAGLVPGLATNWQTPNGLDYTFTLGANTLTGQAVAESLGRAAAVDSFRGRILSGLVNVAAIKWGGDTVTIPLKYPKVELLFLALMTTGQAANGFAGGTGPFALQSASKSEIILVPQKNYRGGKGPKLARITFRILRPSEIPTELKAGRVHFARVVDGDDPEILGHPNLGIRRVRPFATYYLGFDTESNFFSAPEVRQAFGKAIDYEAIEPATGLKLAKGPIPPGVEAHDSKRSGPKRDLKQAQELVKAGQRLKVREIPLLYNEYSYYARKLAESITADLKQAGVTVVPKRIGGSEKLVDEVQTHRRDGIPFVFLANWYSILPAAEVFLRPLFESGMPDNLTGYSGVDGLLEAARARDLTLPGQIEKYREAEETIVKDAPAIFLGHPRVRFSAHHRSVTGLNLNVQSFPVDRFLGVDVR